MIEPTEAMVVIDVNSGKSIGKKNKDKYVIGTMKRCKDKPKLFLQTTDNVGFIKNYYDVTNKTDPKYWEHYFAEKIDSLCGEPMKNLIAKITLSQNNTIVLSNNDRRILSELIVSQLMRVPDSINYIRDKIYPKTSKKVKDSFRNLLPKTTVDKFDKQLREMELSEQAQKEIILEHVFKVDNFNKYCNILENKVWVVYYNLKSDSLPFVTSDNPVLIEGIGKKKTGLFHNGLANPTTCIFYPINPCIAIAIYSKDGIVGMSENNINGRKQLLNDEKFITLKNIKIIEQSYHHSFIPTSLYNFLFQELNK